MNNTINDNYKFWLGGFVEKEGSLIISVVKSDKAPYGVLLQPEFNITQYISGIDILKSFKILFNNKGQILKKSGSNNVWVYSLKGIKNLNNHLVPFFLDYVVKYSCKFNNEKSNKYIFILNKLKDKYIFILNKLKDKYVLGKDEYINIVKLVYNLNPDGKGKTRKLTLLEILSII